MQLEAEAATAQLENFASCELKVQLDGRCSWELVAGRLKGRRSWSHGKNGACAVYKRGSWKLREASWDERAEPKVQPNLVAQSEVQTKRGKDQLRVWLIFRAF